MAHESELPDGWRTIRLHDLGKIVTGKTPRTSIEENFGGGIPFITPSDMDGRRVITETGRYLTNRGADSVSGASIPAGTVMVSCIGSDMGKAALAGRAGVTNQQINSIIVDESQSALYIYYNLSTRKAEFQRLASSGSAQPILNKATFGQITVTLPPLEEQRAIASFLGALDDKIELNRRMNATLEAMAQAIFKSWFVDFDPVRAKAAGRQPPGLAPDIADLFPDGFEESEVGEIPRGWRVGCLGDVAANHRRSVSPDEIEPTTPYIGLEHMPRGHITLHEWGTADRLASGKSRFKRSEMLFGKLRPYFHKVGVAPIDGVCSTDILVIAPKGPEWFGFALGHLSSTAFIDYASAMSTGTRMPRVSWRDMGRYEIAIAPTTVAVEHTAWTMPLMRRIETCVHESRMLAALRDTLLPKLISGELRIPEAEQIIEERT